MAERPVRPTLIVFARAPRLGRVKRRLAAEIGPAAALAFYRRTLARLLARVARDRRWRLALALTPDNAVLPCARAWRRWKQGGGDLGARMARAMARAPGPVVLVGADIPALGPCQIADAFARLRSADAVFGPAKDGGFYLVGLRRPRRAARMFAGARWSTAEALADVRSNLRGRRVALVARLGDVDSAADLARERPR